MAILKNLLVLSILFNAIKSENLKSLQKIISECSSLGESSGSHKNSCSDSHHLPYDVTSKYHNLCKNSYRISCIARHQQISCDEGIVEAQAGGTCSKHTNGSFRKCCSACKLGVELHTTIGHCRNVSSTYDTASSRAISTCCADPKVSSHVGQLKRGTDETEGVKMCSIYTSLCDEDEDCVDVGDSYKCECRAGFSRDHVTGTCKDVDECRVGRHKCEESETCVNTIGSYECKGCPFGFRRGKRGSDGDYECMDVDECESSPCDADHLCENTSGGYKCTKIDVLAKNCLDGFKVVGDKCIDRNECEEGTCSGDGEQCTNLNGGYRCERIECDDGYSLFLKTNCLRKSCKNHDCRHLPLRISHFFKVVTPNDRHKKLFTIQNLRSKTFHDFTPLNMDKNLFALIKTHNGAFVELKNIPQKDEEFKIEASVYNNRKEYKGKQINVYHVYFDISFDEVVKKSK